VDRGGQTRTTRRNYYAALFGEVKFCSHPAARVRIASFGGSKSHRGLIKSVLTTINTTVVVVVVVVVVVAEVSQTAWRREKKRFINSPEDDARVERGGGGCFGRVEDFRDLLAKDCTKEDSRLVAKSVFARV